MTQRFLPRFTCLPASYVLVVTVTHLEVHALIGIQKPNPQRVLLNQHKMKTLNVTSNILECFWHFAGELSPRTPHKEQWVWPRTITNLSNTPPLLQAI